ncbi:MAG: Trk system potassium transporter TrkA [Peptoniphilaceae bacterium]|nr:Trk system potassium transporter TrkA [Peptoniphilaceae bacterium]MCI6660651.1 Trk system potassium transporter TrkA [Peptoniphilaceae bacterium]MDD7434641.1 Trk system potassium transporter TrkA [Peptoniphilaceae bacterium]MDY3075842.1 Trk system potassium transporter TrkA [Peptoniphilaceae bacterium]MDY4195634.1 Trk system potassium transporter TrkA [Peptoniphilaceae bacterium]
MKIVIVGAGKMGREVCESLVQNGHEIILIEKDPDRLQDMLDTADLAGIEGNGSFFEIQKEAGVDKADMFIALTDQDEINIIACVIASHLGAKYTVARVRTPEYADHMGFSYRNLGINFMVNPDREAAREIYRTLQFPAALSVESFLQGHVHMVQLAIRENSILAGISLIRFRQKFPGLIICAIQDRNETMIPSGNTELKAGQHIYLLGDPEDMKRLYREMNARHSIRSCLIIGGGRITKYTLDLHRKTSKHLKVIENNPTTARNLACDYHNVEIILGDGTDQNLLLEENMSAYDCVIAMTGIDEENIMLSLSAQKIGVPRTITKISRPTLIPLAKSLEIQSILLPAKLGATAVIRYVRSISNAQNSSNIEALYRLEDESVEIMQFFVKDTFRALNRPLSDIPLRSGILVVAIARNGELIFPSGGTHICSGDRVLIVSKDVSAGDLNDFLRIHA